MDQELISNVCILFTDECKAIDYATWLNFKHRTKRATIFFVITGPNGEPVVVSDDVFESFREDGYSHPLHGDYLDLSYEQLDVIAKDDEPLEHWAELRGAFSTMDGELLRYILEKKIPLDRLIRHELASRGHDKECKWIGFEKAKELWLI